MVRYFLPFNSILLVLFLSSCMTPAVEPIEPIEAVEIIQPSFLTYETWNPELPAPTSQPLPRLLALWRAFPEKIQGFWADAEDWILDLGGAQFRWAEGRMLSSAQSYSDYEKAKYLPMWDLGGLGRPIWERKILREQEEPFFELNQTYGFDPRIRNQSFLDLLYDAPDEPTSKAHMVWIRFLGLPLQVHPRVVPALGRVETRIRRSENQSPEVEEFIQDLDQVWGFFWRPIAGTSRRSMHSYGIAIDLIPDYYGRRFPYWRWALESGYPRWWTLSPRDYWTPPPQVVRAFEEEGFLWGGRWTAFDTVHFEYRPEYMIFEQPLEIPLEKP